MIVVVVPVVMVMCIKRAQNRCWFRSLTHTPKMKSQYVIAGLLLTLPTLLLTTSSTNYCFKKKYIMLV